MDPLEQPEELKNLTFIEQQVIALFHVLIYVFKLKNGGQLGFKGHVVSFQQNIKKFATTLPISLDQLDNILIIKKGNIESPNYFILNKTRVYRALFKLKEINEYYKDIEIDMSKLKNIPDCSNVFDYLKKIEKNENENKNKSNKENEKNEEFKNNFTSSNALNLNFIDSNKQIGDIIGIDWPEQKNKPINEFEEEGLFVKAFPHLFPYGNLKLF